MSAHHDTSGSGWKPLALRSAACLVATVLGFILHDTAPVLAHALFGVAYLAGGWDLAVSVWEDFKAREFDTHFLMLAVVIGAAAIGQPEEGALLMVLFSASGAMEQFAHGRTTREINALLKSAPKQARLLDEETEREVAVESLQPGQRVRVTAGEQIPVDLQIEDGSSTCDESMITGESVPVPRTRGDTALAGTLNLDGVLTGRVLRAAEDSALRRIIRLIKDAQHLKAPSQRFTDRFGTRYTVIVCALCAAFFLGCWLLGAPAFVSAEKPSAFYRAMTLLVVMSPCALVLSVPSAILSAIAFGAKRGVLFRGGAAIETLARVTTVAMDKTGTLTEGALQLAAIEPIEGDEAAVLTAAAAIARLSNHPMSRSIVREAAQRGITVEPATGSVTIPGQGLRATLHGGPALLGNRELLGNPNTLPPMPTDASEVWVRAPGVFGRLLLRDRIRAESRALVARLHADGIRTVMLTGDKSGTAQEIAQAAGVSEVLAQLRPDDKLRAVQRMKETGAIVAMIGDGVNDAPVLAAADVGVAMGARGSDAAIEQAEVVLMNDRLENFITALELSRRAGRIIRQNIVFSLAVVVAMALATVFSTHLPLTVGVLIHEGSTVVVVLNGLRLLFGK